MRHMAIAPIAAGVIFFVVGVGYWRGKIRSIWQRNRPTNRPAALAFCMVGLAFIALGISRL
jgi:hypothetical protein